MATARAYFTATGLLDGRVLMVGGMDKSGGHTDYLATAELYDPASGKFTLTGSMIEPRALHAAVRLLNGQVLILGGTTGEGEFTNSAELYDPATGTFRNTGSLPEGLWIGAWSSIAATLLPDGRVVAFGYSCNAAKVCLPGAALYDPATGLFSAGGDRPDAAALALDESAGQVAQGASGKIWSDNTATVMPDGQVLVAGGNVTDLSGGDSGVSSAWLYDPATHTWSKTGAMLHVRSDPAAVSLPDGRVLLVGGIRVQYCASAEETAVEVYDPTTGKFSATGSLLQVPGELFELSTVVALADGRVLVAGGDDCEGVSTLSEKAEIYDPATGKFSYTKPMAGSFVDATGTLLLDGRVLIAGGVSPHGGQVSIRDAELYQP